MKSLNYINSIHDNKIDNISERNVLHGKTNYSKCTKYINIHYSPILHGCMNKRRGGAKYKK